MSSQGRFKRQAAVLRATPEQMNQIQPGTTYCHPPLDVLDRARVQAIQTALQVVWPQTLAEWEDGFRRDLHMEKEICWWERYVERFLFDIEGKNLSRNAMQDIHKRLFREATGGARNEHEP